jgi:4-hydroxyphenylpyruvate dioxygenase
MDIDHVHFYVENAASTRNWFSRVLGFEVIAHQITPQAQIDVLRQNAVIVILSAPLQCQGAVADYLRHHPSGVADVGLRVHDIEATVDRAIAAGAELLEPIQTQTSERGCLRWAKLAAWDGLTHTLVERQGETPILPIFESLHSPLAFPKPHHFVGIDHAVLNVPKGQLQDAVTWYEQVLGFERQRRFTIQTPRSGLCSQVLIHPDGTAQIPINEPTSANSQIQEFLDANRGVGIQHIALQTDDIVQTVAQLRQDGLKFLSVPNAYYDRLADRPGFQSQDTDWSAIATQEILVDWPQETPEAMLLQVFTETVFPEPTFFFEIIQRQTYQAKGECYRAAGFGEGNFQALFEAIEQEQMKRGRLKEQQT